MCKYDYINNFKLTEEFIYSSKYTPIFDYSKMDTFSKTWLSMMMEVSIISLLNNIKR